MGICKNKQLSKQKRDAFEKIKKKMNLKLELNKQIV